MPVLENYEVLLIFNNDTQNNVTVELQRTYGRNHDSVRLVNPADSVTLILDAGSVYRYSVKEGWNVADITRGEMSFATFLKSFLEIPNEPMGSLLIAFGRTTTPSMPNGGLICKALPESHPADLFHGDHLVQWLLQPRRQSMVDSTTSPTELLQRFLNGSRVRGTWGLSYFVV